MGDRSHNIGVFDSGFGGLDVLRGMQEKFPEYNYVYLGDTARAPYGPRSTAEIFEFSKQAVRFLSEKNCSLIIFACNTASSEALRRIQREYLPQYVPEAKVLGVLIPFSEEAVRLSKNKKIGVIATDGTVRSGAFVRELTKLDPKIHVFQRACPLLVSLVEDGKHETPKAVVLLRTCIEPLMKEGIDTLILGCTHFGFLRSALRDIVGTGVALVSGPDVVPDRLGMYLKKHPEAEEQLSKDGGRHFYTTGSAERFQILGSRFYGDDITVERATL